MIGTTLGPYEILEPLGAGGMGEVYLGHDTRLGRKVAVKVLPAEFAADPERLARFEQEARAAAALNHPHIAAVFDVGSQGEGDEVTHYMVQEYLEGDTLRVPLDKGALPGKKSLALAAELAEALAAAHAAGIVHRDLKPENIFITRDGHAKVLDFGLAKLTEAAPAMSPGTQASRSPTLLGTVAGQVMGTAGYMAPEQVQGEGEIDHRADLFAFGCVLYEMLTGRRAFSGKNVFETLSQIVSEQPRRIDELDRALPAQLQWIVEKCLAKEPAERYQSAADLAVDIRRVAAGIESGAVSAPGAAATPSADAQRAAAKFPTALAAVAVLALVAISALVTWWLAAEPADTTVHRFAIEYPIKNVENTYSRGVTVSPDGKWVVFSDGETLWIRGMDDFEATVVRGSEARTRGQWARAPVFSPDSQRLAFWIDRQMVAAPIAGGVPVSLMRSDALPHGIDWAPDGYLYYTHRNSRVVWRVPDAGGEPESVFEAPSFPLDPQLLPGGEWLLFSSLDEGVQAYSLATGEQKVLVQDAVGGRYVPPGYIVYIRGGDLLAQRFDVDSASVSGSALVTAPGVRRSIAGSADFAVTRRGDLVYRPGGAAQDRFLFTWLNPDGTREPLPIEAEAFDSPRLSPDETKVVVSVDDGGATDIWIQELAGSRVQRLTTTGDADHAVWSTDGEWVYFAKGGVGQGADIWRRRADLSGEAEPVLEIEGRQVPMGISGDDRLLLFSSDNGADRDLYLLELDGNAEPRPVVATSADESQGDISPDGRFVAYTTDETGEVHLFVVELGTNRRWPVSPSWGFYPRWSPDGGKILFLSGDGFVASDVTLDPEFSAAPPVRLGDAAAVGNGTFDWSVQQQRVLAFGAPDVTVEEDIEDTFRVHVVLNWLHELEQRLPAGGSR